VTVRGAGTLSRSGGIPDRVPRHRARRVGSAGTLFIEPTDAIDLATSPGKRCRMAPRCWGPGTDRDAAAEPRLFRPVTRCAFRRMTRRRGCGTPMRWAEKRYGGGGGRSARHPKRPAPVARPRPTSPFDLVSGSRRATLLIKVIRTRRKDGPAQGGRARFRARAERDRAAGGRGEPAAGVPPLLRRHRRQPVHRRRPVDQRPLATCAGAGGRRGQPGLDELGSGTDPSEGAASPGHPGTDGAPHFTLATTHLGALKTLAPRARGGQRIARVRRATLSPSYRFQKGVPGACTGCHRAAPGVIRRCWRGPRRRSRG
jgi:hypothetical protein